MKDKWNIKKKEYLKIHIAININTKKILAIEVTDEHVHDSKALPKLVNDVLKSDNITLITMGKLIADGAYDSKNIFRCLGNNRYCHA